MTESKGKYQPWYHEAFMSDPRVRRMTPLAAKTYMLLLHEAFVCSTRPHLPDDEEELYLLAFCENKEEWGSVRDTVLGMFQKDVVDGRKVLTNKRLTQDWAHLQEIREARSEAGKASAAKRKSTNAKQMLTNEHKEVSKQVSEVSKESENTGSEDPDMKTERQIDMITQQFFGKKAFLRGRNGEDLKTLILVHKGSSVERAYGEWCQENQDNPDIQDPLAVFLEAADEFLGTETPLRAAAKDPEVVSLTRELTYASGGSVAFLDKQRARLAEVLKEFSAAEIKAAFSAWIAEQDLTDSKNVQFLAGKFVQIVDSLCYSARRRKQEADDARALREETVRKLQDEAETERLRREAQKDQEEETFDPLAEDAQ